MIHILLATYQGATYLPEQLESIAAQSNAHWKLWISDDGSTDETPQILRLFSQKYANRVEIIDGPAQGPARNFLFLLHAIGDIDQQDLICFCDQDDVWLPNKLERASRWHSIHATSGKAGLYMARTTITDSMLNPKGKSRIPLKIQLGNALVENIASGNTMVFNKPLLQALRQIQPDHVVLHDWSTYLAAAACGAQMAFDKQPCLLYRQHPANVVGAQRRWYQKAKRLWEIGRGDYRSWGACTEGAMKDLSHLLTTETSRIFYSYQIARHGNGAMQRLRHAYNAGLRRQSGVEQAGLIAMTALGIL